MVRRRQGARCPCGAAEDGAAGSAQATAQVPLVERLLLLCSGWKLMMEVDVFFPIFCWFGKVDVCCCWYECCAILVGGGCCGKGICYCLKFVFMLFVGGIGC